MENSPLPSLMLRLVAVDAFSQALTNLLLEHVFEPETFWKPGWEAIEQTRTLADLVARNTPVAPTGRIGMTRAGWKPS